MSFTQDDVKKLAYLCRLTIDDKDNQDFAHSIAEDLNKILDMVNAITAINTDDIEPMAHPLEATQRLRSDVITESNVREEMQAIAPTDAAQDGLYLVPVVVEE